jgi:hypothetical protein
MEGKDWRRLRMQRFYSLRAITVNAFSKLFLSASTAALPQASGYRRSIARGAADPPHAIEAGRDAYLLHEWVRPAFDPDRGCGPVAGQNGDIVAKREEFFPDPIEEQIAVAAGQIPPADAARE